jgi:hypothetical protein
MVDDTQSDVTLHTDNECKIAHRSSEPEISDRTSEPEISKEDPEAEVSELKMSAKDSEAEISKENCETEISGRASDNLKNQSHVNDNESGLKQSENIEKQTKGKDSAESANIRNDSLEMDTDSREKHQWEEDNQPGILYIMKVQLNLSKPNLVGISFSVRNRQLFGLCRLN